MKRLSIISALSFAALAILITITTLQMGSAMPHGHFYVHMAWIASILLLAQIAGSLCEKIGIPGTVGELAAGLIIANLKLVNLHFFAEANNNEILQFLAEIGVIILLFKAGLHSTVEDMMKNASRSLRVAIVGVVVPIVAGYFIWDVIFPDSSNIAKIFVGGTLCATSVGITMRIFQDLKIGNSQEAKISLGAGIFDDIIGLIVLAIVLSISSTGSVNFQDLLLIIAKAVIFFWVVIHLGEKITPKMNSFFASINNGIPMQFAVVMFICFGLSYFADVLGLASIIGAFAGGLFLNHTHFKNFEKVDNKIITKIKQLFPEEKTLISELDKHKDEDMLEKTTETLGHFFIPIFFVMIGMNIDLSIFADIQTVGIITLITLVAIASKAVSGLVSGKNVNKWLIGFAMVPRGEVGLIFATIGKNQNIFDEKIYTIIVSVIIITTIVTPIFLSQIIKRSKN